MVRLLTLWLSKTSSGDDILHVGTTRRDASDDGSVGVTAIERIVHPNFDRATFAYDFVLLRLSGWVSMIQGSFVL